MATYRLVLDSKRRPTLPARLLAEAGLTEVTELVARVDTPGRILLEDPRAALRRLRTAVSEGKRRRHRNERLETSLFADRSADTSLE
ncbi:hypothetical protein [Longimycelium tulufanense]|nr:hypothetical protein [Longimycelium tulufanense]